MFIREQNITECVKSKKNQYTQHFIISQSKGHFRYNENVNEQTDINNVGLQARRQVKKMHLQHTC